MELINISKDYNKNIQVLYDINYSFKLGKFYLISGYSGAGKSTLIKILGLLERPTEGRYMFNGIDTTKLSDSDLVDLRKDNISYVFQKLNLHEHLTAIENIELPMIVNRNITRKERRVKALELLKNVGLSNRSKHFPKELSGGECQRIAIARALANNPRYILCDEPTSALDKKNEKKVLEILKKLSLEGYCVIVVSHNLDIESYADIHLQIDNGHLSEVAYEKK